MLAALAAADRPGAQVSAAAAAALAGLDRNTARKTLKGIRERLGLGPWDDIIAGLRARGLPIPAVALPMAPAPVTTPAPEAAPAPAGGASAGEHSAPNSAATGVPTGAAAAGPPAGSAGDGLAAAPPHAAPGPAVRLTPAEVALLRAMRAAPAAGPNGWAVELGVAASGVRRRLTELRQKLDVEAQADLLRAARERGLLPAAATSDRASEGGGDDRQE